MEAGTKTSGYQVPQTSNSDENIVSLFEPDMLVSAQYFENLRSKTLLEPEKRLMLAALGMRLTAFSTTSWRRAEKERGFSRRRKNGS